MRKGTTFLIISSKWQLDEWERKNQLALVFNFTQTTFVSNRMEAKGNWPRIHWWGNLSEHYAIRIANSQAWADQDYNWASPQENKVRLMHLICEQATLETAHLFQWENNSFYLAVYFLSQCSGEKQASTCSQQWVRSREGKKSTEIRINIANICIHSGT